MEIISHLNSRDRKSKPNRLYGYNKKTIKSSLGSFELSTPKDRNGEFEPQIVKKHQTTISDEIENKTLSMYGLGMSYQDISSHITERYSISISP